MTTHVLMIIDMSGSMFDLAEDVRGGFNSFLDDRRDNPDEFSFTVTVFDTEFISLCAATSIAETPRLNRVNYKPRGMTALLDAVGKTILECESKTTLADDDKVLVVVQTDGRENASKEFRRDQIATMIREREATQKWSFLFLGAGPDTWAQADSMGFQRANTVSYGRAETRSAYSGVSRGASRYSKGASGQSVAIDIANMTGGEVHGEENNASTNPQENS